MRRTPTLLFALALVAAALASFGLLFFSERFPSARQREIQETVRTIGPRTARAYETARDIVLGIGPRAVQIAGQLRDRGEALLESGADLLRRRAPRIARLIGIPSNRKMMNMIRSVSAISPSPLRSGCAASAE